MSKAYQPEPNYLLLAEQLHCLEEDSELVLVRIYSCMVHIPMPPIFWIILVRSG
jgi:hypothetical protein